MESAWTRLNRHVPKSRIDASITFTPVQSTSFTVYSLHRIDLEKFKASLLSPKDLDFGMEYFQTH